MEKKKRELPRFSLAETDASQANGDHSEKAPINGRVIRRMVYEKLVLEEERVPEDRTRNG